VGSLLLDLLLRGSDHADGSALDAKVTCLRYGPEIDVDVLPGDTAPDVLGNALAQPLDVDLGSERDDLRIYRDGAASASRSSRRCDGLGLPKLRARIGGQLEAPQGCLR